VKFILLLGLFVLCARGTPVFPETTVPEYFLGEDPVSVEVSSSAALPAYLSSRIFARYRDYRLLGVSLKDFENPEKDYMAAGFDSPWLTAGPLSPEGLFREVFSPLGYSAGSSVFSETSRLSLNTASLRSTRKGIWLTAPGEYVSLGAYTDGEDITHTAGSFNLFKGKKGPLVSGLLMLSRPDDRLDSDVWFPEKPLFPGAEVYHAAFRGQIPFDSFSGGVTRAGVSSAFSFGERVRPAGYYHAFASHTDKRLEIRLLQGGADKEYVTPAGRYPSGLTNSSAALKLFPRGPLIPSVSVSRNVYQVYKPTIAVRPVKLLLSSGLEYKTKRLSLKTGGAWKTEKDSAGRRKETENLNAAFLYKTGGLRFGAEYASGWEEALITSRRVSLRAEYSPKGWEFAARVKGEWKPDIMLSGKLSAALDRPGLKLGLSAELVKALVPRHSSVEALREDPWKYLALSVFFRYKTRF
jgi:hypothetical protein